ARDREVPESIVVAALSSALGCVAAAIARNNGYDLTDFQAFVANHFARVFQAESARPVYHRRAARAESPPAALRCERLAGQSYSQEPARPGYERRYDRKDRTGSADDALSCSP